jgi:hypothetical protein
MARESGILTSVTPGNERRLIYVSKALNVAINDVFYDGTWMDEVARVYITVTQSRVDSSRDDLLLRLGILLRL